MTTLAQRITSAIPEFCMSHWLIRIPLIIVFLQQGISKLPFTVEDAEAMDLPALVWWFVVYGEIGAGVGLAVGGIVIIKALKELQDLITRFSGIVICSIMTGVIWTLEPENLWTFMVDDPFHVMLWVGGLFFALRGNRT
jgi:putative oxidoreductase